jgi:hypothetical protein
LFGHADDNVGEVAGVRLYLLHVEIDDRPGRVINQVNDVIQCGRHHVDVFAIERRDKGFIQLRRNSVGQLITGVFQPLDAARIFPVVMVFV